MYSWDKMSKLSRVTRTYSLNVVGNVDLFILRMGAIIRRADGQEKDILARQLLECQSDRNRATFTGEIRLHIPHLNTIKLVRNQNGDWQTESRSAVHTFLDGVSGCLIMWMVEVSQPSFSSLKINLKKIETTDSSHLVSKLHLLTMSHLNPID